MKIERALEKYYYLTGDEKSGVGNCAPVDPTIHWDYFEAKNETFELKEPIVFKIASDRFPGTTGDYQFNNCGFLLFSHKLRAILEKYLTGIDKPTWFPAQVIDLKNKRHDYNILHFFVRQDLLDHHNSTFVTGTDLPIKKRYDLKKIGERLIYSTIQSCQLCVHDTVRKEIRQAQCTGMYFYKIHTAGRLS